MSPTFSNLQWGWLTTLGVACATMGAFHFLGDGFQLPYLLAQTVVISIVIAQACDPFADAAQWVGEETRLPGSVRGATLDAIASSMPELFSGIFFVTIAITASENAADRLAAGAEGYGATVATCAGSAVYNMILIPAFCAIFISFYRPSRPTIDVEDEVISRDGLWFVSTQGLLVLFLFQDSMTWWMGVLFLLLYLVYIVQLYADTIVYRKRLEAVKQAKAELSDEASPSDIRDRLRQQGVRVTVEWLERLEQAAEGGEEEGGGDDGNSTEVFFGVFDIPITRFSAPLILLASTLVAAGACYFLVEATRNTAATLGVPTFFVAVIIAAAASSLPDTLLSIGAAKRGDDSGAVSNAFGSNIFDICVCTSIPLLVSSYLAGWQPVSLLADGEPIPGLVGLRILLVVLTMVTLAIMWHNRQLTRNKAYVLCVLYLVFIAYAVVGSLGWL